jgi:hypothetical protein
MKAFVIFPTVCVFLLTLTLLRLKGQMKPMTTLLWSIIVTAVFAGLTTWFSLAVFEFLYYSNFLGIVVCIPCLTYLTNQLFSSKLNQGTNWVRVMGLGIISTVATIATAGFLIFISFMHNPMDPPTNKQSTEKRLSD